jgi:hypothetical protein
VKAAAQRACATQLEVKVLIGRQEASSRVWAELRRACELVRVRTSNGAEQ